MSSRFNKNGTNLAGPNLDVWVDKTVDVVEVPSPEPEQVPAGVSTKPKKSPSVKGGKANKSTKRRSRTK